MDRKVCKVSIEIVALEWKQFSVYSAAVDELSEFTLLCDNAIEVTLSFQGITVFISKFSVVGG